MEGFIKSVRFHETAARRVWEGTQKRDLGEKSTRKVRPFEPRFVPQYRPNLARGARPGQTQPGVNSKPIGQQEGENQGKPNPARRQLALPAPTPFRRTVKPFRPCRHCGGNHYDPDCPTMRRAARAYQIAEDNGNHSASTPESDPMEDDPSDQDEWEEHPRHNVPEHDGSCSEDSGKGELSP